MKRPEELTDLLPLDPWILPAPQLAWPYTPVFQRTPNKILQICPVVGHSRAWMEACLLQLPQRLLLLGAAALTVSALETGEYEGT